MGIQRRATKNAQEIGTPNLNEMKSVKKVQVTAGFVNLPRSSVQT